MCKANILLIRRNVNARALQKLVSDLNEHHNVIETTPIEPSDGVVSTKRKTKVHKLITLCEQNEIDFCILVCHSGNPVMRDFQKQYTPKHGYYILEHDLFSEIPEPIVNEQALGAFAFTKPHYAWYNNQKYTTFKTKWYKFDSYTQQGKDFKTAMIVATRSYNPYSEFDYKYLFKHVYLKPRRSYRKETLENDCIVDYENWGNTQALFDLGGKCGFWFTYSSSAFVEALMLKCIPIFWKNKFKKVKRINSVLDTIYVTARGFTKSGRNILAILADEKLSGKIQLLRASPTLRQEVISMMSEQWIYKTELPSVSEVLLKDIKTKIGGTK